MELNATVTPSIAIRSVTPPMLPRTSAQVDHDVPTAPPAAASPRIVIPTADDLAQLGSVRSLPELPDSTHMTVRLPNGVHVILNNRPGATDMNLQIGAAAGDAQDPVGKEGLGHVAEHMLFEGTPDLDHRGIWRDIQAQGSRANAYTTEKRIVMTTSVPMTEAESAITRMTDQFAHPNANRYALAREKRIVQQELRDRTSSTDAQASYELQRLVFGEGSPDSRPVSTAATVAAITPSDLRAFSSRYFVGKNTVALIDGDLEHLPVQDLISGLSQLAPGARAPKVEEQDDPTPVPGAKMLLIPGSNDSSATVTMTFPSLVNDDAAAGARAVLAKVASNKLFQALRERERVTYTPTTIGFANGIVTEASLHPSQVAQGVESMVRTVRRLPASITDADVDTARQQVINRAALSRSDSSASALAQFGTTLGGSNLSADSLLRAQMADFASVSTADVRAAARQLRPENIKVIASGAVDGAAEQIRRGVAAGGWNVPIEQLLFDPSRYDAVLATPSGPLHP